MTTRNFLGRFKKSDPDTSSPHNHVNERLLRLIQLINVIPANASIPDRLAECLFSVFQPQYILFSSMMESKSILKYWHSVDAPNTVIFKSPSSLCMQTKSAKTPLVIEDIKQTVKNEETISQLNVKNYVGIPIFNNENEVIGVLSLFNGQKDYSPLELKALSSIAQRIEKENTLLLTATTTDTAKKVDESEKLQTELLMANKSIESISYTISHDLRAPLRSIDTYSALLKEDHAKNLPEDTLEYLSRIRRAAKRMSSMIDDLLWLARVTRRKLNFQETNISKIAQNIVDDILESNKDYKCDIHIEPYMLVDADKDLIKIAMKNLLGNAFKFSSHQEKIAISLTKAKNITPPSDKYEKEDVFQLSDNGRGIDMTYADQLFEPFKKLHNDESYKGTGIGLATVQRIIQRHGGKIWIESELNEGTDVFFTLNPSQ